MKPPVRIAHIIPHDGVGGVETAARSLAEADCDACEFTLILLAGATLAARRSRIVQSPFRSALNPFAQLRAAWICFRLRPNVLVVSLWRSVPAAIIFRLLQPSAPIVYFLNSDRTVHAVDAFFSRIGIAVAKEVWADSRNTLDARVKGRSRPGRVISFVLDRLNPSARQAAKGVRFVAWSRLHRDKGIDRALPLIAALAEIGIDARFDIWGPDDGELQNLVGLARQLGIAERVFFRGVAPRSQLAEVAAEASFFLQLSRFEGMAVSVVEAMQLGLVPVVTEVGEISRYVTDGANGVIVDPDDPATAARSIQRLVRDPQRLAGMAQAAAARWEKAPLYRDEVIEAAIALTSAEPRHER